MANVILGVSGSVAAYRAADLAREIMRSGHVVRVCLTDAAQEFVRPALFEALTGQPCLTNTFEEPEPGRMAHIDWARWANLIVLAPTTANTMVKIGFGLGDDMLTTLVLAATCPIVIAPAMNPSMYANANTQEAMQRLRSIATAFVEPTEGDVACGEFGQGKLASIAAINAQCQRLLERGERLKGWKILITSGPTQEPIDMVRYLSNRSSGKMGAAVARAALLLGAEVTIVTGPVREPLPQAATVIRVRTAIEMLDACAPIARTSDLIIGVAAVADYRVEDASDTKLRRTDEVLNLKLVPNPDIIATLARDNPTKSVVGFAAEPSTNLESARAKLERKGLSALAMNDVSNLSVGFESDENELHLVMRDGRESSSGKLSKLECALWLLESMVPPAR